MDGDSIHEMKENIQVQLQGSQMREKLQKTGSIGTVSKTQAATDGAHCGTKVILSLHFILFLN
jgi:hypothetical protein